MEAILTLPSPSASGKRGDNLHVIALYEPAIGVSGMVIKPK